MDRAEAGPARGTRDAEAALRDSEAKFEAAFQTASVMMSISSLRDGRFLEVNDAFCRAAGYERAELLGRSGADLGLLVHPEQRDLAVGIVRAGGVARDCELTIRVRNGDIRRGSFSASRIDVDGEPCLLTAIVDMTDRLAAEDALRASDARFSAAFNFAGVMMLIVRMSDGVIVDANEAFLHDTGYGRDEVLGKTSRELALFEDPGTGARIAQGMRENGSIRNLEARVLNRSGEVVYALLSTDRVEIGGVPHLITTVVNTTERRRSEEALRTSEARYRNLVEQTADGVLLLDDDGRIVDINGAMADFIGRPLDELRGTIWTDYIDPDDLAEAPFRRPALGDSTAITFERRVRRPDGSIIELELHARQFARGWMLGTARDVGARKAADRERARLIQAIEQSAESIVITDPAGTIVYVNPTFEKETGFTAAEMIGQNHRALQGGDDPPGLYPAVLDAIAREGSWAGEVLGGTKDGSTLREAVTVSAVRDSKGALTNYVIVQRNITRERELEDQLRQAQKMEAVGRLAGGIAHDFNNLLTAVNGYADLLVTELGDGPLGEDAREIRRAGARAAELTHQVLAFARRQALAPRAVDVNVVVAGVSQMLSRLIGEQVSLVTALSSDPAVVMADPGQLEQVLVNLAINARDAMTDGGILEIRVACMEDGASFDRGMYGPAVLMTVTDAGVGMDAATLTHAFEPFFTTKEAGSGTGLGLATVYGIVHQSHGHVWARSSVGSGTTISVLLPRIEASPEALGTPERVAIEAAGKASVMVVEDDPAVRGFVASTLERAGYRVLSAASPAEAVALAGGPSQTIDVLVTDIVMPEISGLTLARRLLAARPTMRVILMSGYDPSLAGGQLDSSFQFLAKPFSRDDLTAALGVALAG